MFTTLLCGLLSFLSCPIHQSISPTYWSQPNPTYAWSIETQTASASSSNIIVTSDNNGSSTTVVLDAPYGVQSEVVSQNGKTYATTTPLTPQDVLQMEQRQIDTQNQINQIFQDQQKLFNDMWTNIQ